MRALNALSLVLVLVAAPGLAADHAREFCDAWEAAKAAPRYDDALEATRKQLGADGIGGPWGSLLNGLHNSAPPGHLLALKRGLEGMGETFTCDAYEFPAGRPTSEVLLAADRTTWLEALVADDKALYALATTRVGRDDLSLLLQIFPKAPPRLLARSPWRLPLAPKLLLTPSAIVFAMGDALVSVARAGGSAQVLADHLSGPSALALDGDGLVFVDHSALLRVPLASGPTQQLAQLHSYQAATIAPSKEGFVVNTSSEVLFVSRAGNVTQVLPYGLEGAVAVGPELYFELRAAGFPQGLYRLRYGTKVPVRVGAWLGQSVLATREGEFLSLDAHPKPGEERLLRWKPGASTPSQVIFPVGAARAAAFDGKRVVWVDRWFEGLRFTAR